MFKSSCWSTLTMQSILSSVRLCQDLKSPAERLGLKTLSTDFLFHDLSEHLHFLGVLKMGFIVSVKRKINIYNISFAIHLRLKWKSNFAAISAKPRKCVNECICILNECMLNEFGCDGTVKQEKLCFLFYSHLQSIKKKCVWQAATCSNTNSDYWCIDSLILITKLFSI